MPARTYFFNSLLGKLTAYFFVGCILTTSGYALSSVPGSIFHLFLIVPISLLLLYVMTQNKIHLLVVNWRPAILYLILVFISLISTLVNAGVPNLFALAKFWIIITFSYLLTCLVDLKTFINYFVTFMGIFSTVSLLVYFLVNGLGYELTLPRFSNVNDMGYISGGIFFVYDNHLSYRNMGPFWEPGIFGTFISISLFVLLVHKIQFNGLLRISLGICLITTMSTASIIFLFLLICFWATSRTSSLIGQMSIFVFGVISIFFVVFNLDQIIIALSDIWPSIFSKFTATESLSIIDRISSPVTNLQLFLTRPFFGFGLADAVSVFVAQTGAPQTSTSTFFLTAFGLFGAVYTLAWIFGILRQVEISLSSKLILVLFVLSFLNKEPHYYFSLTYILLFYLIGYNARRIRRDSAANKRREVLRIVSAAPAIRST